MKPALGWLVPLAGGDAIPLLKDQVVIGRRPDCDIQLGFANVSGRHCELRFSQGGWTVKDLGSTNGVKVNGARVERKRLASGDSITLARRHHYRIEFDQVDGAAAMVDEEGTDESIFSKSLLEKAGLARPAKPIEFDSDIYDEDAEPIPDIHPRRPPMKEEQDG